MWRLVSLVCRLSVEAQLKVQVSEELFRKQKRSFRGKSKKDFDTFERELGTDS